MKLLYMGQEQNGKKVAELFAILNDDLSIEREISFTKSRNITGYRVGNIYEIDEPEGTTYKFGTTRWISEHPDETLVARLQAQYQASRVKIAAAARERKEAKNDSAIERMVEPIREAYHSLPPSQRTAFEVYLLARVRARK